MNINQTVALNLSESIAPPTLRMAQDDANTRTIKASLWDGAQPFSIPSECVCMVRFGKPDGTGGLYDTTEGGQKVSYSGNAVTAPVAAQMLTVAGVVKAQIDIYGGGEKQQAEKLATFRFRVEVEPSAYADAKIISSDYYNVLSSQIAAAVEAGAKADQAVQAAQQATESASSASLSQAAAASSAQSASQSAQTASSAATSSASAKMAAESAQEAAQAAKESAASSASAAAQDAQSATQAAAAAMQDADDAEAWAVGQRNGVDVPPTDPAYHNNAKYYKNQAQAVVGDKVDSFNGRTGAVAPQEGDYTAEMVGAQPLLTPGDNISITGNTIATKAFPCNPNLLDNWYFGNPVNQRGGHIVPAGTPYFVPGSSTQSGVLSSTATVIGYLSSDGQLYPQVKVGSETYITPIGTDILGYVGVGYGIDRWRGSAEDVTVAVVTGGISVSGKKFQRLEQRVEDAQSLNGITVTFSALVKNPDGLFRLALYNATTGGLITQDFQASEDFQLVQITAAPVINAGDVFSAALYPGANDATTERTCLIKAVKLELGSQQTLAHKEDGVLVLNEIPRLGDQLEACQRYAQQLLDECAYSGRVYVSDATKVNFFIPLPNPMRDGVAPVISGTFMFNAIQGSTIKTITPTACKHRPNGVLIEGTVTSGLAGAQPITVTQVSTTNALLSADL